jgi:tryptophan-rich sensory protein
MEPRSPLGLQPRQLLGCAGWFLVSFIIAAVGARASIDAQAFYGQLTQPEWAPPAWLFGPVWTLLYILMGASASLVWLSGGWQTRRRELALFVVQLALNGLWSWLFFAWHLGGAAFAEIVLLWGLIGATVIAFWRARPLAGMLLVPYLLWVSFAAALNFAVWQLNPASLG